MAEGDVLTIVAGHQAFTPAAGGVQTVTLLGPFNVTAAMGNADPGALYDLGLAVATIPAGSVIIRAWAIVTVSWTGGGTYSIAVGAGDASIGITTTLALYASVVEGVESSGIAHENFPEANQLRVGVVLGDPVDLAALLVGGFAAHPDTGEMDIYALIATPS